MHVQFSVHKALNQSAPVDIHTLLIYGTFIDAPTPYNLRVRRDHVCVVDISSGKITTLEPWNQTVSEFAFSAGASRSEMHEKAVPYGIRRHIMEETQAVAVGVIDCVSLLVNEYIILF